MTEFTRSAPRPEAVDSTRAVGALDCLRYYLEYAPEVPEDCATLNQYVDLPCCPSIGDVFTFSEGEKCSFRVASLRSTGQNAYLLVEPA